MDPKKDMNKSGFKNSFNPHVKAKKAEASKMGKTSKEKEREAMDIREGNKNTVLLSKEYLAKELIKRGSIESYVDFFYMGWKKTPNVKAKFIAMTEKTEEDNGEEENQSKEEEEDVENEQQKKQNESIPRHSYDLNTLKVFFDILIEAEESIRAADVNRQPSLYEGAIQKYTDIRNETLNDQGIPIEAIYFNQKCIRLATKFKLTKSLILSLKYMGDCFDKMNNAVDMNISKALKEKAKSIYFEDLKDNPDYGLEEMIYNSLRDLYSKLANQQEKMKNYSKAIDILNKHLDVLNSQMGIAKHLKDGTSEAENEDKRTESYLKIANLYYLMKDYDNTLIALGKIKESGEGGDTGITAYKIQELYRYAQTYEMQGNFPNAIEYLKKIANSESSQTTDDTLLAKSLLHLGRLCFKQNAFELSLKYLTHFMQKSKTLETKELMDIARVNLGMIKGTQGMKDFITKMATDDYDQFLKWKLLYCPE